VFRKKINITCNKQHTRFQFSEPPEVVLVFHCAEDQTLADDLCQFLDRYDIFTISEHEQALDPFSIDTSNGEYLRSSIDLTTKTLLLVSDRSPQPYLDVVRKVLEFRDLNDKTFLLSCHGDLTEVQIQPKGDYFQRYTDRAMLHIDGLDFLRNSKGNYHQCKRNVIIPSWGSLLGPFLHSI